MTIEIIDTIFKDNHQPLVGVVNFEGEQYIVSVSDHTPMSQNLMTGYARTCGISNLP